MDLILVEMVIQKHDSILIFRTRFGRGSDCIDSQTASSQQEGPSKSHVLPSAVHSMHAPPDFGDALILAPGFFGFEQCMGLVLAERLVPGTLGAEK